MTARDCGNLGVPPRRGAAAGQPDHARTPAAPLPMRDRAPADAARLQTSLKPAATAALILLIGI